VSVSLTAGQDSIRNFTTLPESEDLSGFC